MTEAVKSGLNLGVPEGLTAVVGGFVYLSAGREDVERAGSGWDRARTARPFREEVCVYDELLAGDQSRLLRSAFEDLRQTLQSTRG